MCRTRALSKIGRTTITEGVCSRNIQIWHNNLILQFHPKTFSEFGKVIERVDFHIACDQLPDGTQKLVIRTPNPEVSFSFDEDEFEDFRVAIREALLMIQFYAMMDN